MLPTNTKDPFAGTSTGTSRGWSASSTTLSSIVTVPVQLPLTTSAAADDGAVHPRSTDAQATSASRGVAARTRVVSIEDLRSTPALVGCLPAAATGVTRVG
jgi:hypothetical protein